MSSRYILVDDTDARIEYGGDQWFLGRNQDIGSFGPVWNNTLHGVIFNASVSFTYNGSSIWLYGTIASDNLNDETPSWDCLLDDVAISNNNLNAGADPAPMQAPNPTNDWVLCTNDNSTIAEGTHTITATVIPGNQTFWFDYIKYSPSLDARLDNEAIYIDDTDAKIHYDGIWEIDGPGQTTNHTGSKVNLSFMGTSITWYAMIVESSFKKPHALSTYSIDGQSPIPFEPLGGTNLAYNQVLFEATFLPMGSHNLQVVYNGTEEDAPLNIDFLVIQNGSIPTTSTTPTTTIKLPTLSPSINKMSVASSKAHNLHKAALEATCATLGALIILGGLGILFLRRRRRFRLTPFPIAPLSLIVSSDLNHALADMSPTPIQPQNLKSIPIRFTSPSQDRINEGGVPRRTTRIPDAEPSRVLPPTYTLSKV
ncbi:hypothetical protein BJ912DRAFT_1147825 [Pholiota molesta]|nr:hypothetical protein BJ912DRAFT_1147825 [Pholiota molesta]